MDRSREISVGVALSLAILWFMPWRVVEIPFLNDAFGTELIQSGQHIGGLAWLVLVLAIGFGVAGWLRQRLLAAILAGAGTLICILFVLQSGSSVRWALPVMTMLFALAAAWTGRAHARGR